MKGIYRGRKNKKLQPSLRGHQFFFILFSLSLLNLNPNTALKNFKDYFRNFRWVRKASILILICQVLTTKLTHIYVLVQERKRYNMFGIEELLYDIFGYSCWVNFQINIFLFFFLMIRIIYLLFYGTCLLFDFTELQ